MFSEPCIINTIVIVWYNPQIPEMSKSFLGGDVSTRHQVRDEKKAVRGFIFAYKTWHEISTQNPPKCDIPS